MEVDGWKEDMWKIDRLADVERKMDGMIIWERNRQRCDVDQ